MQTENTSFINSALCITNKHTLATDFCSKSIYGRESTCAHITVHNHFQSGIINNIISYLERKQFIYWYVILRIEILLNYRDIHEGGGGVYRPPPPSR